MSYPNEPTLDTSYTAKAQAVGDGSFPGQELDRDFAALRDAIVALLSFVKLITRSDGKLANGSVNPETLGSGITLGFEPPNAWATATTYAAGNTVFESSKFYLCVAGHASTVFANDLASGRWSLLADFAQTAQDALSEFQTDYAGFQAEYAEFKTRFLGVFAADPVLDADGNPVIAGAIYFNTTVQEFRTFDGTDWRMFLEKSLLKASNLSDLADPAVARQNLGLSGDYLPRFGVGDDLPTADIGPIWHADYNSFMTWQVFDQNGANYTGYASVEIGKPLFDGQPTARSGFLKGNGAILNDAQYPALKAYAQHNGLIVPSWVAGRWDFEDLANGTFRIPDVRGEFVRIWDDGRGVNSGRAFASWEADLFKSHSHYVSWDDAANGGGSQNTVRSYTSARRVSTSSVGGSETRPRNVALGFLIKF